MSESESEPHPPKRTVPRIPLEVTEDEPESEPGVVGGQTQADLPAGGDPAAEQRRWLEKVRHLFAMALVVFCILLVAILSMLAVLINRGDAAIVKEAVDMLKILATTAAGFVFGQFYGRRD